MDITNNKKIAIIFSLIIIFFAGILFFIKSNLPEKKDSYFHMPENGLIRENIDPYFKNENNLQK